MRDPFDVEEYNLGDPFAPSVRGAVYAALQPIIDSLTDTSFSAIDNDSYASGASMSGLTYDATLGRLLYPQVSATDPDVQTVGEIGDQLRGLRLDDLAASPVGGVYLKNIGETLEVRNEADTAYRDMLADTIKGNAVEAPVVTATSLKAGSGETIDVATAAGQLGPREIYISLGTGSLTK